MAAVTPQEIRRACGQLLCVGFEGHGGPAGAAGADRPVRGGQRDPVPAQRRGGPAAGRSGGPAPWWRPCGRRRPPSCPCRWRSTRRGGWCSGCGRRSPNGPTCWRWPPPAIPRRSFAVGRALGEELALLGIGWNFAPVLDVHTNPANPVIGTRAFGADPARGHHPRAGVLAGAARGRGARLWQALPRTRRHRARLAPRPAHGGPPAGPPAHGRAGAVRRCHPGGRRGADERPRDVPGRRSRPARRRCRPR